MSSKDNPISMTTKIWWVGNLLALVFAIFLSFQYNIVIGLLTGYVLTILVDIRYQLTLAND